MLPAWSDGDEEISGWLHVPAALPPEKTKLYTLDRRMDGPQSLSE